MSENFNCQQRLVIVLPSLDPDAKFLGVVRGMVEAGFRQIVIVDDGSDEAHQELFRQAEGYPQCTVLHHGVNKGKGRALKTAFRYVLDKLPEAEGVITIDGDGQHRHRCRGRYSEGHRGAVEYCLCQVARDGCLWRRYQYA